MGRCLTLGLLLVFVLVLVCDSAQISKTKVPEIDDVCLYCICQASSNCNEKLLCHNGEDNSYYCGPYVISWAYWHDAGRPKNTGRPNDFESCLNSKACAEETVQRYMQKYGQDCDGTGTIDCDDFAKIHKVGSSACERETIYATDYWEKFEACYRPQPGANYVEHDDTSPASGNNSNEFIDTVEIPYLLEYDEPSDGESADNNYNEGVIEDKDGPN